jgi:hypothetical protein
LLPDGSADGRRPARCGPTASFAGLPRLELGLLSRATRGVLGDEPVAGLAQPRQPAAGLGQLGGQLIPTAVPERRILRGVDPSGVGERGLDRGGDLGVELLAGPVG